MGPGLDHELTQLRARAYGPDADIHTDPPALARLRELERQASEARRDLAQWSSTQREGVGSAADDTHPDGIELAFGDLLSAGAPAGVDARRPTTRATLRFATSRSPVSPSSLRHP